MRLTCYLLFIVLLINVKALAQGRVTVSGTVTDESGATQKGATVFISGSQYTTATDDAGHFEFNNIDAGTYQVSVKLLGFYPYTQNIQVHDKPVIISIKLKVKSIALNQVVIGGNTDWAANYAIFKKQFLGTSLNADQCVITNPHILFFGSAGKNVLTAEADEFLIIENWQLGYRIRYLLKDFKFDKTLLRTKCDGDTNFEEMDGIPDVKAQWARNRAAAYKGSLMHFLRSVYRDSTLSEGFLAHPMYQERDGKLGGSIKVDTRLIKFDTIKKVIDTAFVSLKFSAMLVEYNPDEVNRLKKEGIDPYAKADSALNPTFFGKTPFDTSTLKLFLSNAVLDKKGNYTDYRTFLVQGYWGRRRIGDQLPFEYQPPVATQ